MCSTSNVVFQFLAFKVMCVDALYKNQKYLKIIVFVFFYNTRFRYLIALARRDGPGARAVWV